MILNSFYTSHESSLIQALLLGNYVCIQVACFEAVLQLLLYASYVFRTCLVLKHE
jgi:hypothetical protein